MDQPSAFSGGGGGEAAEAPVRDGVARRPSTQLLLDPFTSVMLPMYFSSRKPE